MTMTSDWLMRIREIFVCISAIGVFMTIFLFEVITDGMVLRNLAFLYEDHVHVNYTTHRTSDKKIAIVVVVDDTSNKEQYALAQSTVECYAKLHGYQLYRINMQIHSAKEVCKQKDLMFRRHCFVSEAAVNWPEEWILFVDADIGVINPSHLIEDYLPRNNSIDVLFYKRIFNHEVMAGSYMFRNTAYARRFLKYWAEFEDFLPNSFHGSDNGAIHMVLLRFDNKDHLVDEVNKCHTLWQQSTYYDSLDRFEVCAQLLMPRIGLDKISIVEKGKSWSRDGWLTNSIWSPRDFLFHGWQLRRLNKNTFGRWFNPLAIDQIDSSTCSRSPETYRKWIYRSSCMGSDQYTSDVINSRINAVNDTFQAIAHSLSSASTLVASPLVCLTAFFIIIS